MSCCSAFWLLPLNVSWHGMWGCFCSAIEYRFQYLPLVLSSLAYIWNTEWWASIYWEYHYQSPWNVIVSVRPRLERNMSLKRWQILESRNQSESPVSSLPTQLFRYNYFSRFNLPMFISSLWVSTVPTFYKMFFSGSEEWIYRPGRRVSLLILLALSWWGVLGQPAIGVLQSITARTNG